MSSFVIRGYASRSSSTVAPSYNLRSRSSTGIRVLRITGLPCSTDGLISIRPLITATYRDYSKREIQQDCGATSDERQVERYTTIVLTSLYTGRPFSTLEGARSIYGLERFK